MIEQTAALLHLDQKVYVASSPGGSSRHRSKHAHLARRNLPVSGLRLDGCGEGHLVLLVCVLESEKRATGGTSETGQMRVKFNSLPSLAFSDATGVFSTARIERPLLYRGGSASTEPCQSPRHPLARLFFSSQGSLVDPRMRASNEHTLIVRVPRAGGRPGCPSWARVPSHMWTLYPNGLASGDRCSTV